MKQVLSKLLWEITRRGNQITTFDLKQIGSMQYQRDLRELREEVAKLGWTLTYKEKLPNYKRNYRYRLIKSTQMEMAI